MAIINKTGIGDGNLIQAEHVTRIIDALSSGTADVIATGSFTGSFKGDGSQLTGITVTNATSASYAATASYLTGTISSASFASTASYLNPLAQNVIVTGSLTLSGSSATSLTVQKASVFNGTIASNNTASFNNTVAIGGSRFESIRSITTTDATQTNIWSYSMADGESIAIEALVIGASSSLSGGGSIVTTFSVGGNLIGVCRNGSLGSNVTGQNSSSFENFSSGDPMFGVDADGLGGSKAYVWVKGLSSTTINWEVSIRYNAGSDAGGA